ncbi:hypothetical protein BOX15_Mlig020660g1, partial [Macrostomum lignano]
PLSQTQHSCLLFYLVRSNRRRPPRILQAARMMAVPNTARGVWLLLLLLPLSIAVAPVKSVQYVDIVEDSWEDFTCDYDADLDSPGIRELALFLLDNCSATVPSPIPADPEKSSAAIIYLGDITGRNKNYRKIFGTESDGPFFNDQHRTASQVLHLRSGDLGSEARRISVSAGPQANGKCLVCAQSRENYAYSETRRARVRTLRRPSVWLSVNRTKLNPSDALQVRQNDSLTVSCNVAGNGTLSARLLRDGVVLREGQKEARLELAKAQPSDSGFYRCEGSSNLEPLRQRNLHFAATNCSLLVKFAPKFEVDEIVRYTPVGQEESIQVKIRAYPEPQLACRADPPEAGANNNAPTRLMSYDQANYYAQYRLVYSNLDRVRNFTRINCMATNEVGQSRLEIELTALAPKPTITSDNKTSWWNSYHLTWQHHVNASIDSYRILIVYLQPNGSALNTTEASFAPKAKRGPVAMVSSEEKLGQRRHNGVVFNLLPEAAHDISLKSCNRHGCSEFSRPVRVRTVAQSHTTFNDPNNPKYRRPLNLASLGPAAPSWSLPLALLATSLVRRLTEY